jgi:hypothetical protein
VILQKPFLDVALGQAITAALAYPHWDGGTNNLS